MLTPKGLLGEDTTDKLMLYMYKINRNGIVLDKGNLHFVELVEEGNNE